MYAGAVKYGDTWLAPGSQCLELYKAKKFKELDALIKELDAKWRKLEGRSKND